MRFHRERDRERVRFLSRDIIDILPRFFVVIVFVVVVFGGGEKNFNISFFSDTAKASSL